MRLNSLKPLLLTALISLLLNSERILAQSAVSLEMSQVFSTFKFVDSNGNTDKDYSPNIGNAFNLGYLHTLKSGLMFGGNIGLRKAGASKEVDGVNLIWNYQYAEAKLGIGYVLNIWRIKPYLLISPYYSDLLKATETIGGNSYDLKKDNAVSSSDFGLIASAGVRAKLSDFISMYSSYNQIYGMKNIEITPTQKTYNRGFSISLGIAFTITKSAPKWIQQ
jgi:hypothetical protein